MNGLLSINISLMSKITSRRDSAQGTWDWGGGESRDFDGLTIIRYLRRSYEVFVRITLYLMYFI